jgi:hypothetical protein
LASRSKVLRPRLLRSDLSFLPAFDGLFRRSRGLAHHSVDVELNIPSYRLAAAKRSQQENSSDAS